MSVRHHDHKLLHPPAALRRNGEDVIEAVSSEAGFRTDRRLLQLLLSVSKTDCDAPPSTFQSRSTQTILQGSGGEDVVLGVLTLSTPGWTPVGTAVSVTYGFATQETRKQIAFFRGTLT